jgi:hypothetical protein
MQRTKRNVLKRGFVTVVVGISIVFIKPQVIKRLLKTSTSLWGIS